MKQAVTMSGFLTIITFVALTSHAQPMVDSVKIDPILRAQFANSAKQGGRSRLYPCIIYSKDPQSLQRMGIHLNSIFPTFSTARLTKKQIVRLVKTVQVTYIASPKPDQPQLDGDGL